jgi:hypothetical protein
VTKRTAKIMKEFNSTETAIDKAIQILRKHKVKFDANALFLFVDLFTRNQKSGQNS